MTKKPHPADDVDRKKIVAARHFNVHLRIGPSEKINHEATSLSDAIVAAGRISANNRGKRCLIYAITPDKGAILVPKDMLAAVVPAPAPKGAGRRPTSKRAAIEDAAKNGTLPAAPDFSAETHKRFRPKLEKLIALVEAGDIEGLKAIEIKPISSSPKAMARYRDLCLIALAALPSP